MESGTDHMGTELHAKIRTLSTTMETAALVAPVTALEFVQDSFLLTGEGPDLKVYSLQPQPKPFTSRTVLQHVRIHGIRPRRQEAAPAPSSAAGGQEMSFIPKPNCHDVAVFGGKVLRLLRLHVDLQHGDSMPLKILGPVLELQDWVLDVHWLSGGRRPLLGVVLAHNSALLLDAVTGAALVQRSCLEGCLLYSALLLVHESWAETVVVGGTVFNQLVLWKPGERTDPETKAPVERRLLGHCGVIFSISYLKEKGWLASASDDRSVRVWGVGFLGGPGGKCGDMNPVCLRVLYGHQARVFSVRLSPGKVFSAGEDGSCLVWDWTGGGKVVRTLKGHRAGGVRALAVSEETVDEERWVATGGADGGVRLWKIKESEERGPEEAVCDRLTDLRFPGPGSPKAVCVAAEDASWSQSWFVVCTDEGRVFQYGGGQWQLLWQGPPEFQSYCVMETVSVGRSRSAGVHLCAVANLSGSVYVFPVSHPPSGILLTGGSGKIHSLIWQEMGELVCLLASGAEGLVYRWCIAVNLKGSSVVLSVDPLPSFLLPPSAKRWLTAAVCLHPSSQEELWVCGDRRGSLLLFQDKRDETEADERLITCAKDEEKSGGDELNSSEEQRQNKDENRKLLPLSCLFGAHGKQGVTSVCEQQGLLYSTGRDGCVRVFRVQPKPAEKTAEGRVEPQLEVLRVQRACKGMEWLERVLVLEPEDSEEEWSDERENHGEKTERREKEARFVIAGFHATHFVVWDPVRRERLLAVPCGGGHRSWGLWPSHKGVWPGYGALVFIKQGTVMASQAPAEEPNWAGKAGMTGGWGLREGVHGRGIGCVCRLGRIGGPGNGTQTAELEVGRQQGGWEVVVTGGEDTSAAVLGIHPDSGSVRVLSVITDHISSVRTVTAVTGPEAGGENPPQSISALLTSAGGRAQIQCYRLLVTWDRHKRAPSCQVVQVAGHRLGQQWERRRNRHKTVKMDPETRYMSAVEVVQTTDGVLLALGCSDGAVRFFSISEAKHQIHMLWESFFHQRCVLSVATCSLEDGKGNRCRLLFSAATDGSVAVWNLTEASSDAPAPPIPCLSVPAHQSGVNSLAVWAEDVGLLEGGCLVTVASGGDDGQLTVSVIRVLFPEDGKSCEPSGSLQTQLQPPDQPTLRLHAQHHIMAHAAPLTALKILRPGLIVSTSSDQRVCIWKVCSTGVSHKGVLCSHVADTAGLAVWEEEGNGHDKQVDGVWRVRAEGETVTRFHQDKEPDRGEPVEPGDERGAEYRNPSESDTMSRTEAEKGPNAASGWVLVCGQGVQLIRVKDITTAA